MIVAHDKKAYQRWQNRRTAGSRRSGAMAPQALEGAIRALARSNPEYVVVGA